MALSLYNKSSRDQDSGCAVIVFSELYSTFHYGELDPESSFLGLVRAARTNIAPPFTCELLRDAYLKYFV
jgi:hypothetical protein